MSDHQIAFAHFPGENGTDWTIDIFQIEAIGQSVVPEIAIIFTRSQGQYRVVAEDGLATDFIMATIAAVARASAGVEQAEADDEDDVLPCGSGDELDAAIEQAAYPPR